MCHFHFNAIRSLPLPAFSIPALEHTHSTHWIHPCTHPKSDIFAYPELISENPIWGAIHNLIIGRSCQVLPFSCVPFSPCVSCCGCRVLVFFFLLQNIPYGSCSVWLVTGYTHAYQKIQNQNALQNVVISSSMLLNATWMLRVFYSEPLHFPFRGLKKAAFNLGFLKTVFLYWWRHQGRSGI